MSDGSTGPDLASLTKKLAKSVSLCSSEEDLRVGMEFILREALPDLPNPKYEKGVQTSTFKGRADAVHQGLVIEYEKPGSMSRAKHRDHAVQQVCDYLTGFSLGLEGRHQKQDNQPSLFGPDVVYSREDEEKLAVNVGLATDGKRFVFVQRWGKAWHTDDRRLDEDTVEKLLLWLRAMVRKDLSPENLIGDFGHETQLAADVVGVLAKLVDSAKHPKPNVIYDEWKRIFGIVYGTEQLERTKSSDETKALTSAYQIKVKGGFPVVLFAVHTYYALLMKMLATEVIVAQGGLGDTFIGMLTRTGLRDQLAELESGGVLRRHNIRNAIEQDFFGWYPEAWSEELQDVLWRMTQTLVAYDIGTFQIKPDRARDLLKDLYHGLIPESVRHALGEYYTPDWLAEHTIDLAGYDGDPSKSLLDASCGSGTFLVMAILKVRQWLTDRAVEWNSNAKKLEAVNLIRHNIVGFDLNPLAVIAARTNYLFALGPLLRYRGAGHDFEIPVYLTDSVLLPGKAKEQGDLFAQDTVSFPMTVGTFDLPMEVVEKKHVPDLMNLLHDCIADGHNRDSFINRSIKELHLADQKKLRAALGSLFAQMAKLDSQGKNRVWAKLIRNRYAALFFRHHFDFVVGNPPHVNWEALTPEWRKAAEEEYKNYGMFTLTGHEGRHGGGKKDIAALFTYAVMDHFVKPGGVLALVVHVSLFKTSGAGEGYRRFQLGKKEPFRVEEAHDFASFQPFQTHAKMKIKTRTLSFRAVKGKQTTYPVPYRVWGKTTKGFIPGGLTWPEAEKRLDSELKVARPLRGLDKKGLLTPWLTLSEKEFARCKKVIAPAGYVPHYEGHAGAFTGGLNGAYFVEILERYPNGTVLVRNEHDTGKIECPEVQATIEADLLYPLIRGRSIAKWRYTPMGYILIVQDPETKKGFSESWMQETHPLTWAYLKNFEALLRERKAIKKVFDLDREPFYSMYAVASYTFSPYKVAWMDISSTVKATAIVSNSGNDMPMPEHGVLFLTTDSADEAYYVSAVLNSEPVNAVVSGYIVDNHLSTCVWSR
jgi:N-6 DNA Methylase